MANKIELPLPYRGVITPIVTPLSDADTIDTVSLKRLINHLISGGIHGIFLLGTTGEGTSLSYRLKHELIEMTCEIVNHRVPVLVCITDSSISESILLARFSANNHVAAVVAAPPFYFNLNRQELIRYYQQLADQLPLPLFLYNLPAQTKIMIEASTVQTLAVHPNIIGIKDSSGNMPYFHTLLHLLHEQKETFSVFAGPDEMLSTTVLMGGHGGVNAGSNLYPRLFVELYHASVNGDLNRVLTLHKEVMQMSVSIYQNGDTGASFLKGLKSAMQATGICNDLMLAPLIPLAQDEKSVINKYIKKSNEEV